MVTHIPFLLSLMLGLPLTAGSPEPPPRHWAAPWPAAQWRVDASVGRQRGAWRLSLWKTPHSAFTYTVDPSSISVAVRDHLGRSLPATLTAVEPVPPDKAPARQAPGELTYSLHWDVSALKPEMYNVSASALVRATDDATGQPIKLPPVRVTGFRFYKTPEPDVEPSLKPGQRFLFIPRYEPSPEDLKHREAAAAVRRAARNRQNSGNFAVMALATLEMPIPDELTRGGSAMFAPPSSRPKYQMPYADAGGAPVAMKDVVLKVFTLESIQPQPAGPPTLEFSVEGRKGRVWVASVADVEHLSHLTPLVEDSTVRTLRAKYEGKWVWFNGGGGFECITLLPNESGSSSTEAKTPYKVKRLVRLYQPNATLAIGGAPGYMGPRDSEFSFDNPILAVVDVPPKAVLGGLSWGGFALGDDEKNMPYLGRDLKKLCAGTVMYFADAWDMDRQCRREDPVAVARKWPGRYRAAIARGELRRGMAPDMVVAVMGWPNEYATPDEMRKRDAWRYDSTPPYNYWVNFKRGRVVSFGPDGQLP